MANPRCYEIDATAGVFSSQKSVIGITSASTVRPEIYDVNFGTSSTPADNALIFIAQRYTAAGTNTSVTPSPLDPADPAALTTGAKTYTGEPTYTANLVLFHVALNQRATHRWIADQRGPLKCPSTASNGIGIGTSSATYSGNSDHVLFFCE